MIAFSLLCCCRCSSSADVVICWLVGSCCVVCLFVCYCFVITLSLLP